MSEEQFDNQVEKENKALETHNQNPQATPEIKIPTFYAGFWIRFWAYLLDVLMVFSINGILIKPVFRILDISLVNSGMFSPYNIASAIVFYAYFILMTKFFGQTIGKMIFGLKVVSTKEEKLSWGTVIFREGIGRYIATTVKIIYVVIAFLPKKQGLHDIFADTVVLHEPRNPSELAYY